MTTRDAIPLVDFCDADSCTFSEFWTNSQVQRQPPRTSFEVSKACTSLCMWVHAMYKYYFVNKSVAPKKATLATAKEELAITEKALAEAKARMKEVMDGLAVLEKKLQDTMNHKAKLEANMKLCEDRMGRAVRLVSGLADEKERWKSTVASLGLTISNVIGDVLISAGAVAYLTPFTDKYRRGLLKEWLVIVGEVGVPHTVKCTPVSTLGEPVTIRKWQLEGLPRDFLSTENAVLVFNSTRWPLFIDPQRQANRYWNNRREKGVRGHMRLEHTGTYHSSPGTCRKDSSMSKPTTADRAQWARAYHSSFSLDMAWYSRRGMNHTPQFSRVLDSAAMCCRVTILLGRVNWASGLAIAKLTDRDLLRSLESAVRFGKQCLIENVGTELDPALDSVLQRQVFRQAGTNVIKIGDSIVPYNEDFRLFITTKLPNPSLHTRGVDQGHGGQLCSRSQDQLLALVVMEERPDLEEARGALIVSSAQMRHELKEIEDRILYRLSVSEGSPVDDIDLINTLEASKVKSEEIKLALNTPTT
uniref:(California timema) hypothetical protein n=1 Tax=Timema californicum TaxID=61474 RepID=A0A7R9PC22_TIMCA|nr:unnamed protein product [Timema californicum]